MQDINNLLEKSFYDVMNAIFSRTIYKFDEKEMPIFAFVQKQNLFYIYDTIRKDNDDNIKCWVELSKETLTKFLVKVHMKILKSFYDWKNLKKNDNKLDESLTTLCDKTIVKLMNVEFNQENIYSKARNMMYSRMKTDMKSLVELELEFEN